MIVDTAQPSRNGLSVAWDLIVAPRAAFAALRARGTWIAAFAIVCVLGTLGAYLQVPAGQHILTTTFAHQIATDPNLAAMTPEKQKQALEFGMIAQRYAWLAFPLIAIVGIACSALILMIAVAIGNGTASYGRLFALCANIAIINYGIAYLIIGLLAQRIGAENFASSRDLIALLPSPARFAPENAPKLATLLSALNPFQLWSFVLLMLGLRDVSGVRMPIAIVAASVISFGSTLVAAALVK
jgi:hypothetical protein